jgi:hypothetical protein
MHLSYWIDEKKLLRDPYWKNIVNAIKTFNLVEDDGELILKINDDRFGDALFSYIQALMRIVDTTLLKREKTLSSFQKDLNSCIVKRIVPEHLSISWNDQIKDQRKMYTVDYRINGNITPILIFGLDNEVKVLRTAVTLREFKIWNLKNFSIGIFEERSEINQKSADKLSDICDKTYSEFYSNEDNFVSYLEELLPKQNYLIPATP